MHRRRLLGGVGLSTVFEGCLGGVDSEPGGATADFERVVSVADTDNLPDRAPIEFELRVRDERVTTDGTAFLELETTNGSEVDRTVTPYYKGPGSPEGVLLYSLAAADAPGEDHRPECADDPEATRDSMDFTTESPVQYELEPGETAVVEYVVVDDPSVEGCLPPGEYRFESTLAFEGIESVDWGFVLGIEAG